MTLLLATAVSMLSALAETNPCQLSDRDQALLIAESQTVPQPGSLTVRSVAGVSMQCAQIRSFLVLRETNSRFLYVLDTKRAFDRWTITGARANGDLSTALSFFLLAVAENSASRMWRLYGREPLDPGERKLALDQPLRWSEVTLMDQSSFASVSARQLDVEVVELIRELTQERVVAWVYRNGYEGATQIRIAPDVPMWTTERLPVSVTFSLRSRSITLDLQVQMNGLAAPYVGSVIPPPCDRRGRCGSDDRAQIRGRTER